MKSVLISIRPNWCELIAIGKKTIEVRKTRPKSETPFKCYIYCTLDGGIKGDILLKDGQVSKVVCGMVIGEFVCDKVVRTCGWRLRGDTQQCAKRTVAEAELPKLACLAIDEIVDYAGSENREVVGWHISELKIYDKPRELIEFFTPMGKIPSYMLERPPQSWCYVEEQE